MIIRISLCCENCKEPVIQFHVDNIRDIVNHLDFYRKQNTHQFKTGKEYYIQEGKNNYIICNNCSPRG